LGISQNIFFAISLACVVGTYKLHYETNILAQRPPRETEYPSDIATFSPYGKNSSWRSIFAWLSALGRDLTNIIHKIFLTSVAVRKCTMTICLATYTDDTDVLG